MADERRLTLELAGEILRELSALSAEDSIDIVANAERCVAFTSGC